MSSVLPILAAVAVAAVLVAGAVLTLRRTRRSRLGQGEIVRREALLARELEAIFATSGPGSPPSTSSSGSPTCSRRAACAVTSRGTATTRP
jgi:hypothetical protein